MAEKLNSSIDKTLGILDFISQNEKGVSLSDIVRSVGIPKTTTFRILEVLVAREYVARNSESEKYTIGLKTLEVGLSGLISQDIVGVSIPYLQELSANVGETSFLAVYNSGDVVYLYKAEGTQSILTTATLGSRRPAYCTALGKVILANLPNEESDRIFEKPLEKMTEKTIVDRIRLHEEFAHIRLDGYGVDDESMEPGLFCLAAPVYDFTGKVVASISVSGPVERMNGNRESIVEKLKNVSGVISKRLGYVRAMRGRK